MIRRIASIAALVLLATPALAHTGPGAMHGIADGLAHPFGGADHLLAMVAVGLWSAQIGGRARWLLPLTFVATMAVGGLLGIAGAGLPLVETGIAASIIVLGLAVLFGARLPLAASAAGVALFALFHGFGHGAEMPLDANGMTYGLGFVTATALLHLAGLALATALRRTPLLRPLGGAIALAGIALGGA